MKSNCAMKRLKLKYFYFVGICYHLSIYVECQQSLEKAYSRHVLCDVARRMAAGCMQFVGDTRSNLECAARCSKDPLSTGHSIQGTSCYNHHFCRGEVIGCALENTDHVYYKKLGSPCYNAGVWNEIGGSCKCHLGWIGQFCEKRATCCRDLYDWGYSDDALIVYLDIPGSTQPLKVMCRRNPPHIETYVFANPVGYSFNKTWDEYENGFFEETTNRVPNFFIGLKPLHLLNEAGLTELVLGVKFYDKNQGTFSSWAQVMRDVRIGDANSFYEIDFERVGLLFSLFTQSDCMSPLKKMKFSTWDKYHASGMNHAKTSGAGWWFSDMGSPCNPLGEHCTMSSESMSQCVYMAGIQQDLFLNKLHLTCLFFQESI